MKITHHDGERLVLAVKSGSLSRKWLRFIGELCVLVLACGLLFALPRSIRCGRWDGETRSCQITEFYDFRDFSLHRRQNYFGALVLILVILINLFIYIASPYRVRIIFNRTENEALLLANFFPLGTALKEVTDLNSVYLEFRQCKDSDDDTYYQITLILNAPEISTTKYVMIGSDLYGRFRLEYTYNQQDAENYWQFDPDIQLLKRFIRTEKVTN